EDVNVYLADEFAATQYPDTILPVTRPCLRRLPKETNFYVDSWVPWDKVFGKLPADTLSIYYISHTVYENEKWDSIRIQRKILQRYDLSLYDLQKLGFSVYYPPTEAMRNMKM